MVELQQSKLKAIKGINKLNVVIDWNFSREELELFPGYDRQPSR